MGKIRDLKDMKFDRLLVLKMVDKPVDSKEKRAFWLCLCDCGNEIIVGGDRLTTGNTKSCGCLRSELSAERSKTHGLSDTRFMRIWSNMKGRCHNQKDNEYKNYGAKGIIVIEEWHTFENFMNDMYTDYIAFEEINGRDSATIDRIDSSKNYCKENCQWQTYQQQARNRSNNISVVVNGVEYSTLSELAETYDLSYQLVYERFKRGKRDLNLVKPPITNGNTEKRGGIQVEVDGVTYDSLSELQKAYPYISVVSISKRYKQGKRGLDLIRKP